ncbi:hypothetical protein K402DRAFT_179592 [Aulographum hederae CBS 113979]|uniref:Uncharacterized protein n=1 Tax=Aulographum hederae CBS 113979 TaxID=1176131 RepID=A0A6G1GR30_9PEZI|nr:hypothetical protein K402DRAFT_179592 [Aulographum hederae CBS 113979]
MPSIPPRFSGYTYNPWILAAFWILQLLYFLVITEIGWLSMYFALGTGDNEPPTPAQRAFGYTVYAFAGIGFFSIALELVLFCLRRLWPLLFLIFQCVKVLLGLGVWPLAIGLSHIFVGQGIILTVAVGGGKKHPSTEPQIQRFIVSIAAYILIQTPLIPSLAYSAMAFQRSREIAANRSNFERRGDAESGLDEASPLIPNGQAHDE